MADRVRYNMDRLAGVFRQMEEAELFTKDEVKTIVKKRTDFEYVMMRSELKVDDVTSYLDYEHTLEKLLCMRIKKQNMSYQDKNRQTLQRNITNETIKHINYIYTRALRRFPTAMPLYFRAIEFLQQKESTHLLDMLLGKAIALQPREGRFYIIAAQHEVKSHSNIYAARVLLQQGLRSCENHPELWQTYLDLEAWNLLRAKERLRLLNLPTTGTSMPSSSQDAGKDSEGKDLDGIIGNKLSVYNTQSKREEVMDINAMQGPLLVVAKYAARNLLANTVHPVETVSRILSMARGLYLVSSQAAEVIETEVNSYLDDAESTESQTVQELWRLHRRRTRMFELLRSAEPNTQTSGLLENGKAIAALLRALIDDEDNAMANNSVAKEWIAILQWLRLIFHKAVHRKIRETIEQAHEVREDIQQEDQDLEEVLLQQDDDQMETMESIEIDTIRAHIAYADNDLLDIHRSITNILQRLIGSPSKSTPITISSSQSIQELLDTIQSVCSACIHVNTEGRFLHEVQEFVRCLPTLSSTSATTTTTPAKSGRSSRKVKAQEGEVETGSVVDLTEWTQSHQLQLQVTVEDALKLGDWVMDALTKNQEIIHTLLQPSSLTNQRILHSFLDAFIQLLDSGVVLPPTMKSATNMMERIQRMLPWLLTHPQACSWIENTTSHDEMVTKIVQDLSTIQNCLRHAHHLHIPAIHLAVLMMRHLQLLMATKYTTSTSSSGATTTDCTSAFQTSALKILNQFKRDYVHVLAGIDWKSFYLLALENWQCSAQLIDSKEKINRKNYADQHWVALLRRGCQDCDDNDDLEQMLVDYCRANGLHEQANHMQFAKRRRL